MQTIKYKRWIPHIIVGAIASLVLAIWSRSEFWSWNTIICWAMFLVGSIGGSLLIDRHNRSLTKRIQSSNGITWDVVMNGVNVGTITDAQYAAIQQYAFNNWHNVVKQFLNVGRSIYRPIGKLCIIVPFVAFWVAAAAVFFSPESFTEIVQNIQNADPGEITLAVKAILKFCILLSVMTIGFMFALGEQFVFKNAYSDEVARMVRQKLLIPAEGEMRLERVNATVKSESTIN